MSSLDWPAHQLGEVDRAAAHHVYYAALDLAYLVQITRQLRPAVVRQQRQERAVRQAHELLLFAQRLQYACRIPAVHTVEHELELQKISARRHLAARPVGRERRGRIRSRLSEQ